MKQPRFLVPNITSRCNANCIFCSRRYARDTSDMDFDLYARMIDGCPGAQWVLPITYGEPLLHPRVVDMVKYATDRGKMVKLYTNASLLDEKMAQALLDAGLNILVCSVDDCDAASYEKMRRGLSFQAVRSNIERFVGLRNSAGYTTQVIAQAVVTVENEWRIDQVKAFWQQRVDLVATSKEFDYAAYGPPKQKWYTGRPLAYCERLNEHLTVLQDGTVVMCCMDQGYYPVGDLKTQTPLEAFNSPEFEMIRTALNTGENYPYMCHLCLSLSRRRKPYSEERIE